MRIIRSMRIIKPKSINAKEISFARARSICQTRLKLAFYMVHVTDRSLAVVPGKERLEYIPFTNWFAGRSFSPCLD